MAEGHFIRRGAGAAQKSAALQEESHERKRIRMLRHYIANSPQHPDFAKWKAELADLLGKPDEVSRGEAASPPLPPLEPETHPLLCKVVHLPVWPEPTRAVPNGILRSALFPVGERGTRRFVKDQRIAALDGLEVFYTGERLDQGDLDVWLAVVHLCRRQALGEKCFFTAYELLKLLGKADTGGKAGNRIVLASRLKRLQVTGVSIRFAGRYSYQGPLIASIARDEDTHRYAITLDPKVRVLFELEQYTQLEWEVRRALDGKPLAQWVHAFYATHAAPFPMKISTLRELCGSEVARERDFKPKLRKALEAVAEASAEHAQHFSFSFEGELVCVQRTPSASQKRHLAKKKPPRR